MLLHNKATHCSTEDDMYWTDTAINPLKTEFFLNNI
jgi:hypothetical protein